MDASVEDGTGGVGEVFQGWAVNVDPDLSGLDRR